MVQLLNLPLNNTIDQLQNAMFDSIGSFYVVDTKGVILCANQTQLDWIGLNSLDDIIGKTAYQTPWEAFAEQFEHNNQEVIQTNGPRSIFEYTGEGLEHVRFAISQKKPLYHDGKIIGIKGRSIDVPLEKLHTPRTLTDQTLFIDTRYRRLIALTPKRRITLFFTLKGLTAKEVAARINLSRKTIEHHLEFIKDTCHFLSLKEILLYVKAV